ncbi:MAG: hypothetical protein ABI690_04965 [Chloroflexota bacterium]
MSDEFRALWDSLGGREQNILCNAGHNPDFEVRAGFGDWESEPFQRQLVEKGLLLEIKRGVSMATYSLTNLAADVLLAMPDNLKVQWWPLPKDIVRMKAHLATRRRDE